MPKPRDTRIQAHREPSGQPPPDTKPPLGDSARHAAFRAVVRQVRRFPEFNLAALDDEILAAGSALDPRDAAFAYALYDAVVRRWLTLEFLLGRCLTQNWPDLEMRLRSALLCGAAQLLFLDRVPPHAAINHAVEWAKVLIRPGAGSMVNAVLRRIAALRPIDDPGSKRPAYEDRRDELPLSDGSALALLAWGGENGGALPEDDTDRLSIATSHPRSLLDHWLKTRPMRDVRALAMHSLCDPPTILHTAHARSPLPNGALEPHSTPDHSVFLGTREELRKLLAARQDIWVQDPGSSACIDSVRDLAPRFIVDFCAGQGTKTRQLAAAFPNARIIATDVDEARFQTLTSQFAGSDQVAVVPPDQLRERFHSQADLVLLDVPCSNTGVLARRPEARYRFDTEHLASVTDAQRQIIADSIPLLGESPRGRILYSTCSLEPQENAEQIAWACKWHRFRPARDRSADPAALPGDPPNRYRDGSYSALLT